MHKVVVCIPTYKRPEMLGILLQSIMECNINDAFIKTISIIVVDNDIDKTGEVIVNKFIKKVEDTFGLYYYNFPVKGLSNVRNELLNKAFQLAPDFIIFIDDDEYVTYHWLDGLFNVMINNHADAVRGPVIAKLRNGVKREIAVLFDRKDYPNNSRLSIWTTGNLMLRATSLLTYQIWFDQRFNETGSEDYYFGLQMEKRGASLFWAADAVVYEDIPEKRSTLKWVIRRTFRGAVMYTYVQMIDKNYNKIIKKAFVSVTYILIGVPGTVFIIFQNKFRYWGLLKLTEGIGGFIGLFNGTYREYK